MKPKRTNHVAQMRAEGSNVVVPDRDVAKAFPDSVSVNKALRSVLQGKRQRRPTARATRARAKAARAG